ncbi:MAG: tetratricopeptide repeat protein [Candidatus Obscuribacterales bacterium]|jgi:hypothetical protein|nr:tetratricopeptide repeat protein [Candidatus Obscuribacterales bacterium]
MQESGVGMSGRSAILVAAALLSITGLPVSAQDLDLNQPLTGLQAVPIAYQQSTGGGSYVPNARAVSLYNLGLSAFKQGSPESAIIFFKRACDIDPNLADAQYNLGVMYQMQKRYKEAIPRFEEVLRIKPADPDAHFQLGIVLQDTGRQAEGRQHLMAIAPNNPHFTEAQRRLSQPASAVGQPMPIETPPVQPVVQQAMPQPDLQGYPAANPNYGQQPYQQTQVEVAPPVQQTYQQPPMQQTYQQPPLQQPVVQQQPIQTAYVTPPAQPVVKPAPVVSKGGPVAVLPGTNLQTIASGFSAPSGLAFDRNGNLYIANYMTNSIERVGADGVRKIFSSGVNLRGPIGLVADENNNLYVANYNSGTVIKINPAGISAIVARGFRKPYYLTLGREGSLYVSQQEDNSVVRIVLPNTAAPVR